jgi:hypothetical protein
LAPHVDAALRGHAPDSDPTNVALQTVRNSPVSSSAAFRNWKWAWRNESVGSGMACRPQAINQLGNRLEVREHLARERRIDKRECLEEACRPRRGPGRLEESSRIHIQLAWLYLPDRGVGAFDQLRNSFPRQRVRVVPHLGTMSESTVLPIFSCSPSFRIFSLCGSAKTPRARVNIGAGRRPGERQSWTLHRARSPS